MSSLKICKIYLNEVSKTMVFEIYFYIFIIKLVYCILVNHITISCLKVKPLGNETF